MELKKHKNRGIYAPAKISQLKESPYEKRLSLRKIFAATRPPLRNHPQAHVCHFATQKPIS